MYNVRKLFLVIVALFLFSWDIQAQCAMCRAVLESEEGMETAKGINNGIIYLMVFPYLLVGGVLYAVYRVRKKTKQQL